MWPVRQECAGGHVSHAGRGMESGPRPPEKEAADWESGPEQGALLAEREDRPQGLHQLLENWPGPYSHCPKHRYHGGWVGFGLGWAGAEQWGRRWWMDGLL